MGLESKPHYMTTNYTKKFDMLLVIPLALYILLIVGIILSAFIKITPEAVTSVFKNPAIWDSAVRSFITSLTSTALALVVAIPAGYILSRRRFYGHDVFDSILDLPIVMPPLVIGLCILLFFSGTNIGRFLDRGLSTMLADTIGWKSNSAGFFIFNVGGIVVVQFVVGCAFAIRVIKSAFDELDSRYEDVAMTLGATPWQSFRKISLPNALPGIMAAAVISWARIFGVFGPIHLLCGTMRYKTEILPTTIYLEYSVGNLDGALVVSVFMIIISMITLFIFKKFGGKMY